MPGIALDIVGLNVRNARGERLLDDIDLTLRRGEPLVIIGETGSGKSLIAQALFGLLPREFPVAGKIDVPGVGTLDLSRPDELRAFWGERLFLMPQEPRRALDPTMRIGRQIAEGGGFDPDRLRDAIDAVDLPGEAASCFPHMLSGGMAQRALVACALYRDADVIVADEPTKGLDAPRAGRVVENFRARLAEGRSLLVITHDLEIVRRLPGQVAVLRGGTIVERGATADVLDAPAHPYTRDWLAADPGRWLRAEAKDRSGDGIVAARNLAFGFERQSLLFRHVDMEIARGEIVGLAGPSGCGKTTFGNLLLGLQRPSAGTVHWRRRDIQKDRSTMRRLRQRYQKLHQDPASAFVPHRSLRRQFADLAEVLPGWRPDSLSPLIERMKLGPSLLDRRPHEISGGEAQRLALARVLALRPDFIVADEPTSRLDPIVQRDVLDLLREISEERAIGVLLISHDRAMLDAVAHRIVDFATFMG